MQFTKEQLVDLKPDDASDPMVVFVFVVQFKRNPATLWECLYKNERLAACRAALEAAGHEHRLRNGIGAAVFVSPGSYASVLERLTASGAVFSDGDRTELSQFHGRHMIVDDELASNFFAAVQSVPHSGRENAWPRYVTDPIAVVISGEEADK